MKQGQTTALRTTCPTLCDKCVGSLITCPANHVTRKMQEMGPTAYNILIMQHFILLFQQLLMENIHTLMTQVEVTVTAQMFP